jgi:hypothetical protein
MLFDKDFDGMLSLFSFHHIPVVIDKAIYNINWIAELAFRILKLATSRAMKNNIVELCSKSGTLVILGLAYRRLNDGRF